MCAEVTDNPGMLDPDRYSAVYFSQARDRWQHVPIGGGARSRIGDNFAILEAILVLDAIIGRFAICFPEHGFPRAVPFTLIAGGSVRARGQAREPATAPRRGANADV